jgi:phospholipase D1/2
MAVKEKRPERPVPSDYAPANCSPHTVQTGETLVSIAKQYDMSWRELARLNWNTSAPEEINWYLSNRVGCRTASPDGNSWIFQTGDDPGVIYVPSATPDHRPGTTKGDHGADPPATPPVLSKRQGQAPLPPDGPLEVADSFWVDQKIWAPVRTGNSAQFLIDGSDAMASMDLAIRNAKKFVYITDWAITPEVRLVRGTGDTGPSTLLELLTAAAKERDVQVRIMLYRSKVKKFGKTVSDNHDEEAEITFENANSNIRVSRHRWNDYWSHHQKTLIVDGEVAFLGGVDFTSGRWDTHAHPIFGSKDLFDDTDFYNSCIDPSKLLDKGIPRRNEYPRMPWHDVHLCIVGLAVSDVERNFVERWNFQRGTEAALKLTSAKPKDAGKQSIQIVRSVCAASVGEGHEEHSILDAYCRAIRQAQHFIYIENQFFTSNFGTDKVTNQIANEIAERIIKAIDKKERFRVFIVLPVHAEGVLEKWATQETIHWQYQTIIRSGANSLVRRIRQKLGADDVSDYLGFYNLRGYGTVGKTPMTEQIYVHAKTMIVDDRFAIIGSANINDRSMLGSRDTEICAIVIDEESTSSQIDGKQVRVRNFAQKLRLALWREHLGDGTDNEDPVADTVYRGKWRKTAEDNTKIFEEVFPNIPSNKFRRLDEQRKAAVLDISKADLLKQVKGHLTLYPLQWLENEDLETYGLPDQLFTIREDTHPEYA